MGETRKIGVQGNNGRQYYCVATCRPRVEETRETTAEEDICVAACRTRVREVRETGNPGNNGRQYYCKATCRTSVGETRETVNPGNNGREYFSVATCRIRMGETRGKGSRGNYSNITHRQRGLSKACRRCRAWGLPGAASAGPPGVPNTRCISGWDHLLPIQLPTVGYSWATCNVARSKPEENTSTSKVQ
jgi:hypothetical protein